MTPRDLSPQPISHGALAGRYSQSLDPVQTGLSANGASPLAGNFDPIVAGGIVTGGDHRAATGVQMIDGKV